MTSSDCLLGPEELQVQEIASQARVEVLIEDANVRKVLQFEHHTSAARRRLTLTDRQGVAADSAHYYPALLSRELTSSIFKDVPLRKYPHFVWIRARSLTKGNRWLESAKIVLYQNREHRHTSPPCSLLVLGAPSAVLGTQSLVSTGCFSALARTSATCTADLPVPSFIWWRQLKPQETVAPSCWRTAGKRRLSPICMDTSYLS